MMNNVDNYNGFNDDMLKTFCSQELDMNFTDDMIVFETDCCWSPEEVVEDDEIYDETEMALQFIEEQVKILHERANASFQSHKDGLITDAEFSRELANELLDFLFEVEPAF